MSRIAGQELVEAILGRWSPSDMQEIHSLAYEAGSADEEALVHVLVRFARRDGNNANQHTVGAAAAMVTIQFSGAQRMRLEGFGQVPAQISGPAIDDIRDRQWEGLHYKFYDYEDDRIHLYYRSVEVLEARLISQ